jgi:hypothetical protein
MKGSHDSSRPNQSARAQRKKRSYNVRLVKRLSYTIREIAELFEVHPQAARRWTRNGLRTIDERKPFLVHGGDLIAFLNERQSGRKHRCQPNQFFCCRCRSPRRSRDDRVTIHIRNTKQLNISGRCEECGARLNRAGSVGRLNDYRKTFVVQTTADRRIREDAGGGVMCHLDEEKADARLQPQE